MQQVSMLDPGTVTAPGGGPERLQLVADGRQRRLREKPVHPLGDTVQCRNEKMSAAAGRVQNPETEQLAGGARWVTGRNFRNLLQVLLQGRKHGPHDQVVDEQLGRVIDAARLAATGMRLPEELSRMNLDVGWSAGAFVPPFPPGTAPLCVQAKIRVGDGQLQRQQALIDVAEVSDGKTGVVHAAARLRVPAEDSENRSERGVGNAGALQ
jgi:hypothetical protein